MRPANDIRQSVFGLYGLAAALLLLGLLFGKRDENAVNRIPLPARLLSSALVLASALLLWRGERPGARRDQARLVAAAMGCGTLGDLIMAEVIPLPEHVAFGMLTFGAGHTLYIGALRRRMRVETTRARVPALGVAWAVALVGWWALARNPKLHPALNYGALGYAVLLSSMTGHGRCAGGARSRLRPGGGRRRAVSAFRHHSCRPAVPRHALPADRRCGMVDLYRRSGVDRRRDGVGGGRPMTRLTRSCH
jgi:hypothetical protein